MSRLEQDVVSEDHDRHQDAPEEIFAPNDRDDVYSSVFDSLGPWQGNLHRRAVMLEVMRVLAGFESSWGWNPGLDRTNPISVTPDTIEAGAWQVSANSTNFGEELKNLVIAKSRHPGRSAFQKATKEDHALAMEYIARLLRRTTHHNGPDHGQLEFSRIDSPILLPVRGRCLTKMLPVSKGWDGNNEEATEHGSEAGADRSRG